MKIRLDIDCTPAEARAALGLPDVKPMQDALLKQVEDRMQANIAALDPETMFKTWLPASIQGFEQLQKMFWSQITAAAGGRDEDEEEDKKK